MFFISRDPNGGWEARLTQGIPTLVTGVGRLAKGTPTLAFIFKEGVIVAAEYISSQSVKKIVEINSYMLGGAAHYQLWHKDLVEKVKNSKVSVDEASMLLLYILYSYNSKMGTMIAGWDEKGPELYLVDNEAARIKADRLCIGSGCYATEVLDNGYRFDLSLKEAAELAKRAIYHATSRDGVSGGVASDVLVYHVGPNGWEKLPGNDVVEAAPVVEHEMTDTPIA